MFSVVLFIPLDQNTFGVLNDKSSPLLLPDRDTCFPKKNKEVITFKRFINLSPFIDWLLLSPWPNAKSPKGVAIAPPIPSPIPNPPYNNRFLTFITAKWVLLNLYLVQR